MAFRPVNKGYCGLWGRYINPTVQARHQFPVFKKSALENLVTGAPDLVSGSLHVE